MVRFQHNDLSLESQWRALILFGKNSATEKLGFVNVVDAFQNLNESITQKHWWVSNKLLFIR